MPEDQLVDALVQQWPCREAQFRQLSALLKPTIPSPAIVVAHGTAATGKSTVVRAYLEAAEITHALVPCHEAITERYLLERILALVKQSVTATDNNTVRETTKCENVSILQSSLATLLQDQEKFILVLDGIDQLEDRNATLLPALSRIHEKVQSLIVLFVIRDAPSRLLRQHGSLNIHFPSYTREELIEIVSRKPLDIFLELPPAPSRYTATAHEEDKRWLWCRYIAAVYDALGQNAARSLDNFHDVCNKLWRCFLEPVVNNELGTRDFSRLMVAQRKLFQDDSILLDSILSQESEGVDTIDTNMQHEIPYYAKWLLAAAFLASMNPTRLDTVMFSKSSDPKRRKKASSMTKSTQQRKFPRHLLQPSPFSIERLTAILHAILPDYLQNTIDIQTQLATLKSLRLLSTSAGIDTGDVLEATRWRIGSAVTFEMVSNISGKLDFALSDYLAV